MKSRFVLLLQASLEENSTFYKQNNQICSPQKSLLPFNFQVQRDNVNIYYINYSDILYTVLLLHLQECNIFRNRKLTLQIICTKKNVISLEIVLSQPTKFLPFPTPCLLIQGIHYPAFQNEAPLYICSCVVTLHTLSYVRLFGCLSVCLFENCVAFMASLWKNI